MGAAIAMAFQCEMVKLTRRALYSLAFLLLIGSLSGADPNVGTWKLNLAKSKYPPPQPKEETAVVVD